ncbi:MAG: NAD-dependent epimerase/dehydratase family protein [Spirochaetes bacterium]|nr:NAD-dependent epimerase/dehydratase family protein [Spirochaetota bacterium]
MQYKNILVTGGAGFAGSHLALLLKEHYPATKITALDNLKRRGSELNLPRLKAGGVVFMHGDIRSRDDLLSVKNVDLILECSAEPSVLAGLDGSPDYLIQTNLMGTVNCLELARERKADFLFLSTSRVYPIETINSLAFYETATRFELADTQQVPGASAKGFSEDFPLNKSRSLYGATKLASELLIEEYRAAFGMRTIINRCGVLTGPWQMGKVDQGVIVHWVASHIFQKPLKYFGYGGTGKQVRDILHVRDLFDLLKIQIERMGELSGSLFNVGGGREVSVSLAELTALCEHATQNKLAIEPVLEDRVADIRIYLTDNSRVAAATLWQPKITAAEIVDEIARWVRDNQNSLKTILG